MICDTTFLVDFLQNNPAALKIAADIDSRGEQLATTAVSVFEIWQWVISVGDPAAHNKSGAFLDSLIVFHFDTESAKIGATIHRRLKKLGQTIESEDSMIAGICLNNHQKILTRNVKHFSRIVEMQIEKY